MDQFSHNVSNHVVLDLGGSIGLHRLGVSYATWNFIKNLMNYLSLIADRPAIGFPRFSPLYCNTQDQRTQIKESVGHDGSAETSAGEVVTCSLKCIRLSKVLLDHNRKFNKSDILLPSCKAPTIYSSYTVHIVQRGMRQPSLLLTLKQYKLAKLTPIEAGCCRPPSE
ncbi:hypothetical protein RND71_016706 [Anisodus tanguticus]|uniref:Uncharacterized protein n=1 Tax=Anisodus tanguticus TaxID=243964 RepID=A0AAE1VD28_9SOLA|nr:hypothetical protein RND71_016706 [Anisodus tanguticus]